MHSIEDNKLFQLQSVGFSDKEMGVYLALLKVGKGSVLVISKDSGVDRTTTYRILQSFLNMPIAQTFLEDGKTKWAALNPRYLVDYIQKKKRIVTELFPDLEALYNLNEEKPRLVYFEGKDGLADLVASMVKETKNRGEMLSFSAPGAASGYYSTKRFENISNERVEKQILSRILIPSIEGVPGYKEGEDWKNWRHIKIVNSQKFPFKASFDVWNNKVALLTTKSHPIGVVVESKDIADTFRSIFNIVWGSIE